MMLAEFRSRYPQGSLVGELVKIDRGTYIVKVLLQVDSIILATALASADTVEAAEDAARERAIATLIFERSPFSNGSTKVEPAVNTVNSVPNTDLEPPTAPSVEPKQTDIQNVNFSEAKLKLEESTRSSLSDFDPAPVTETREARLNLEPVEDVSPTATTANLFEDTFSAEIPENPNLPADNYSSTSVAEPEPEPASSFTSAKAETEAETEAETMDFNEIKQKTDIEIKRLGWTKDDGREFLKSRYGKRSRLHLTDEQLLEFLRYLEKLPNPVG